MNGLRQHKGKNVSVEKENGRKLSVESKRTVFNTRLLQFFATEVMVDKEHNHPLLLQRRRHRLTEENPRKFWPQCHLTCIHRVTGTLSSEFLPKMFGYLTRTHAPCHREIYFHLDIGNITTLSKNWARASQLARCTLRQARCSIPLW